MTPAQLTEIESMANAEADSECQCADCGSFYELRDGMQPSALCDECAQKLVSQIPALCAALREAWRTLESKGCL